MSLNTGTDPIAVFNLAHGKYFGGAPLDLGTGVNLNVCWWSHGAVIYQSLGGKYFFKIKAKATNTSGEKAQQGVGAIRAIECLSGWFENSFQGTGNRTPIPSRNWGVATHLHPYSCWDLCRGPIAEGQDIGGHGESKSIFEKIASKQNKPATQKNIEPRVLSKKNWSSEAVPVHNEIKAWLFKETS